MLVQGWCVVDLAVDAGVAVAAGGLEGEIPASVSDRPLLQQAKLEG